MLLALSFKIIWALLNRTWNLPSISFRLTHRLTGDTLKFIAFKTALCGTKFSSSQCAVKLKSDMGETQELQISVVNLIVLTYLSSYSMCLHSLQYSSSRVALDECFQVIMSYRSSRWWISSQNPLSPTTDNDCPSITKCNFYSVIWFACTVFDRNFSRLYFISK